MSLAATAAGATQSHGSTTGTPVWFQSWRHQGKQLSPAPGTGEGLKQPRIPRGTAGPSPHSIPALCLTSLAWKRQSRPFPAPRGLRAAPALNGRLYVGAAVTSRSLATANGGKKQRGLSFRAGLTQVRLPARPARGTQRHLVPCWGEQEPLRPPLPCAPAPCPCPGPSTYVCHHP